MSICPGQLRWKTVTYGLSANAFEMERCDILFYVFAVNRSLAYVYRQLRWTSGIRSSEWAWWSVEELKKAQVLV